MTQLPLNPDDSNTGAVVISSQGDAPMVAASQTSMPLSMMPSEVMGKFLDEYTRRRNTFRAWMASLLKEGVHYGYVPGVGSSSNKPGWKSRPSMYKSGAELLVNALRMRVEWTIDRETWEMFGNKPGMVCYKAILINEGSWFYADKPVGAVLGEGRGAFMQGEKKMEGNSVVKMAEKRAMIDAVLNTLGLSDLYTQDLEDYAAEPSPQPVKDATTPKAPTRAEAAQQAQSASPSSALYAAWSGGNPQKTKQAFADWVTSKLLAIGRTASLSKDAPLTADDCDKLAIILEEEQGL